MYSSLLGAGAAKLRRCDGGWWRLHVTHAAGIAQLDAHCGPGLGDRTTIPLALQISADDEGPRLHVLLLHSFRADVPARRRRACTWFDGPGLTFGHTAEQLTKMGDSGRPRHDVPSRGLSLPSAGVGAATDQAIILLR